MLPDLAQNFGVSAQEAAQVVSSFAIAYGLLQAFYGPLGDRVGKFRLVAWATLACTLGSLGGVLAHSMPAMVLARLLTGATAAAIIPLSMAWIGDTIAYEERQATLARFLAGQIFGVIGGQFIGGLFTDSLGFRWAFGFMALTYAFVGSWVLWESWRNESTRPVPSSHVVSKGVLGQSLRVFSKPWARRILITVFLEGMAVFGPLAFIPTYVHARWGLSFTGAGALMAAFGVGGFSYILFARPFVARFGEIGLSRLGGVVLGMAWLVLALGNHWLWAAVGAYLIGLGYYMLHNTLQTNATQMAPEVRGTAVSLFASAFFLGQSLGVVIAGNLLARWGIPLVFLCAATWLPLLGWMFSRALRQRAQIIASGAE